MGLPKLEHPIHTIELPSTGQKIRFRPFLVKEEKFVLMTESDDTQNIINILKQLIENCILDEGINVNDFTIFDIQYIFLQIRGKSAGEHLRFGIPCSHCEKVNSIDIKVDDIKVQGEKPETKIQLNDQIGIVMKYPTVSMFCELQEENIENDLDTSWDMVIECIESIYDNETVYDPKEETKEERYKFLESLDSKQWKDIKNFFDQVPKLRHEIEFNCVDCGKPNKIVLEGLQDFFQYLSPTQT